MISIYNTHYNINMNSFTFENTNEYDDMPELIDVRNMPHICKSDIWEFYFINDMKFKKKGNCKKCVDTFNKRNLIYNEQIKLQAEYEDEDDYSYIFPLRRDILLKTIEQYYDEAEFNIDNIIFKNKSKKYFRDWVKKDIISAVFSPKRVDYILTTYYDNDMDSYFDSL